MNKLLPLLLMFLLGGGVGAGALHFLGDAKDGDAPSLTDGESDQPADAQEQDESESAQPHTPSPDRGEPSRPAPTPQRAGLKAYTLDQLLSEAHTRMGKTLPPRPQGEGRLQGTVHLRDGSPLAGADVVVHVEARSLQADSPPATPGSLAELKETLRKQAARQRTLFTTQSGSDGAFTFNDIAGRIVKVEAFKQGYSIKMQEPTDPEVRNFVASKLVKLNLIYKHVDGKDFAAGTSFFFEVLSTTSPDGELIRTGRGRNEVERKREFFDQARVTKWLAPAQLEFGFGTRIDGLDSSSYVKDIDLTTGESEYTVVLETVSMVAVRGYIVAPEGFTLMPSRALWYYIAPNNTEFSKEYLREISDPLDHSQSPLTPNFERKLHESGSHRVVVFLQGAEAALASVVFDAQPGVSEVRIQLRFDPADFLRLRLIDAHGQTLEAPSDATLRYSNEDERDSAYLQQVARDESGVNWFARPKTLSEHEWTKIEIEVENSERVSTTKDISGDMSGVIDVVFKPNYSITFQINGCADLESGTELNLTLYPIDGTNWIDAEVTQRHGDTYHTFELETVPAGSYFARISLSRSSRAKFDLGTFQVTGPGQQLVANLPQLYTVWVMIPEEYGDSERVRLMSHEVADFEYRADMNEERSVKYSSIPAGTYTVWAGNPPGGKVMEIVVRGDERITFEGKELNCLVVTIEQDHKHDPDLKFQAGDVIYGMDGKPFTNFADVFGRLMGQGEDAEVELDVYRGGQKLKIMTTARSLLGSKGVEIVPTHKEIE